MNNILAKIGSWAFALIALLLFFAFLGTALYLGAIVFFILFLAALLIILRVKIAAWWYAKKHKTHTSVFIDGVEIKLPPQKNDDSLSKF